MFATLFSDKERRVIKCIPVFPQFGSDKLVWYFDKLGSYSVKSGFKYLKQVVRDDRTGGSLPNSAMGENQLWNSIW